MNRLIAITISAAAILSAQSGPGDPGLLPVANTVYRFNNVQIPTVAFPVDVWATVWHPDGLPGGPYPLIIFLHGNHGICRQPGTMIDLVPPNPPNCPAGFIQTPNHLGYDYIAPRLAGHGYIVASINANAVNVRANGNPERGRLVQEHLRYWALWNSAEGGFPFDRRFSRKVDLQRVGFMGHSRGGEGVRAAYAFNQQEGSPFGIKAVFEIGPVDFGRIAAITVPNPLFDVENTAFSVLLPACDGDVSDNQGMRVYDRARVLSEKSANPKSQLYILGANHNFYNSEWLPEDPFFQCIDFPIITDRPMQEAIGQAYVAGFFRHYIGGEDFRTLFTGDAAQPADIRVPVAHSFTESPNDILMVDNFSDPKSPDTNNAGGANTSVNLEVKSCSGDKCNEPRPRTWVHDEAAFAGRITWPLTGTETPRLTMRVAKDDGAADVSTQAMLAFRVAAIFDPRNPNTPTSQNFSVRLTDATGAQSPLIAVGDRRAIPYPTGAFFRRSVLRTQRIPLADFRGVDLKQIASIQFVFDKQREGAIFLTDVHFSPR